MNIAIVDDLQEEREKLKACLDEYIQTSRIHCNVRVCKNAEELMEGYRPLLYTIIFLDIYMPGMSGIEAAEKIRETDSDTILIFLTDSMEHMPEAFNCHAYDYIQKPADPERIRKIMDEITRKQSRAEKALSFISDRESYSIPYKDIVALCSAGHYLEISDRNGNTYTTRMTFAGISKEFEHESRFLLINRGILVNMDYILGFGDGMCQLEGNLSMPANVRNSKNIEEIWHNYLFSKLRRKSMERSINR